jgi:hypothetical protein
MRLNLIDLFVILLFLLIVYGGSCVGRIIGEVYAPDHTILLRVIGALAAPTVLLLLGYIDSILSARRPPYCVCGASGEERLPLAKDEVWLLVHKCECGRKHILRGDRSWYRVVSDDSARLFLERGFFHQWKRPSEKRISKKILRPPQQF